MRYVEGIYQTILLLYLKTLLFISLRKIKFKIQFKKMFVLELLSVCFYKRNDENQVWSYNRKTEGKLYTT